ncbi:MAG: DUF1294 domain-containing protein [Bacteroidales bacterium]
MPIIYYLITINILSAFIFFIDKKSAIIKRRRISEITLHFLELLGGIFGILIMMYLIHHKNKKASYFIVSYLILIIWLIITYINYDILIQFINCKFQ